MKRYLYRIFHRVVNLYLKAYLNLGSLAAAESLFAGMPAGRTAAETAGNR